MRVRAHACSGGSCGGWHALTRSASRTQVPSLARHAAEDTGLPRGGSRRLAARWQSLGPSARRTEAGIGSPRRLAAEAVIGSPRGSCGSARCIAAASRSRFAGNFAPQQRLFGSFRDGGAAARPLRYFGFRAPHPGFFFCRTTATVAQQCFWPGGQGCHSGLGRALYC